MYLLQWNQWLVSLIFPQQKIQQVILKRNCSVLFKTHLVSILFDSCCETPKSEDACCVTSGDIKEIGDWSKLQCEKRNLKGSLLSLLEIVVINI